MSRQVRQNVFIDVEEKAPKELPPQEEVLDMKPPEEIEQPPPEKPTEEKIFKKELKLEAPVTKRKADRKTDQKRTVTPKMRAHLDRIRQKASESKTRKAQERKEKEKAEQEPKVEPELEPIPEEPVRTPYYPQVQSTPQIDYDRIVSGLWDRQQKHKEEQDRLALMREQIRKEEREKAFQESSTLFQAAAAKYKKNQEAQLGKNVLNSYQNRYSGHPVFQVKKNPTVAPTNPGAPINPFDACFK